MSDPVRVSIIIPTYNRADLLEETIRSVQAQTCDDFEIIVVDDASTDDTPARMAQLAAQDARIQLLRQPRNQYASAARNRGLQHARGEFVNFLDSDDLFAPGKLAQQLAIFEAQPDLDAVICQAMMFEDQPDDAEFVWGPLDATLSDPAAVLEALLAGRINWGILQPLWRRAFLERIGPSPEDLLGAEESEMHVRALCHGARIAFTTEPLAYVRVHYGDSGRSKSAKPWKLRARLRARRLMWANLKRAGQDSPANRRSMTANFLRQARTLARAGLLRATWSAWACALRSGPDWRARGQLLALVPALSVAAITGRGHHFVKRVVRKLNLEPARPAFMQVRLGEDEA